MTLDLAQRDHEAHEAKRGESWHPSGNPFLAQTCRHRGATAPWQASCLFADWPAVVRAASSAVMVCLPLLGETQSDARLFARGGLPAETVYTRLTYCPVNLI